MMRTYRRVVRQLNKVLKTAGTQNLFSARVFEDLCFTSRAIAVLSPNR